MPWMRIAIGVGGSGLVAGLAGMVAWIDDGSHYFELAVALASTGFLTLVGCVLTRVFGSSHGSQDDAFRRGQSMGYDSGFLEGRRTARPVVVPLRSPVVVPLRSVDRDVDPDLAVSSTDIEHVDVLKTPPTARPLWGREAMPAPPRGARDRVLGWVVARRMVLVAGVMSLAVLCVLAANASVPTPVSAEALLLPPSTPGSAALPPSGSIPGLVSTPGPSGWSVSVGAGGTLGGSGGAGVPGAVPAAVPAGAAAAQGVQAVGATVVRPGAALSSLPNLGAVAHAAFYSPAVASPANAPVAAPVVPLTAAQKTAADALAAANLTQANALADSTLTAANAAAASSLTAANALVASDLTAANAAAAALKTARVAAAAAESTRLQALADAYAVAHPAG